MLLISQQEFLIHNHEPEGAEFKHRKLVAAVGGRQKLYQPTVMLSCRYNYRYGATARPVCIFFLLNRHFNELLLFLYKFNRNQFFYVWYNIQKQVSL